MRYMSWAVTLGQALRLGAFRSIRFLNPSPSGQSNLHTVDLLPVLAVLQVQPFLARGSGHDLTGAALEFLLDAFGALRKWDVLAP